MKALALRRTSYGESDLVVQFFTEQSSLLSAFARGARNSKKRFPHRFHPGGLYDIELQERGQMPSLLRCELSDYDSQLMDKEEKFFRWMMVIEWLSLEHPHAPSFSEVLALREAMKGETSESAFHSFFIRETVEHGFEPELQVCVHCREDVLEEIRFSLIEGGLIHKRCGSGLSLSQESHRFMKESLSSLSGALSESMAKELEPITIPYLEMQLGRPFRTRQVFRESTSAISIKESEQPARAVPTYLEA